MLVVVAIVPLSLSLTPYAVATATNVESLAISLTKDHGGEATKATANLRLQLWGDALRSGLETGSLGLGPGPHLERPNVINKQALHNFLSKRTVPCLTCSPKVGCSV